MGTNGEGGRLYRKLSLPARFGNRGSLRKSPKPTPTMSRPPAPDPPELCGKPPALPPKPPALLLKPSPLHLSPPTPTPLHLSPPTPTPLHLSPPTPTPQPPQPTPRPSDKSLKTLEVTPNPPELIPQLNTRILLSKGYATTLLQGIELFRSDETLCDVTLESGDGSETFPVHRLIMAAASEYFRAMFTGGMKEEGVVKLQGVSGRGLRAIVDFVYTGGLKLDTASLRDTLEAASHLQVQPVLQLCDQLLSSELTVDNCLEVGSIAAELQREEVQRRVREFVCANFPALVQSGQYLQLPEPSVSHALSSNALSSFTEEELYRLARDWLDQDPAGRREHAHRLMSHVRFPLMAPAQLLRITQEDAGLRSDPACAQLLLEASTYQTLPYLQPALQTARTRLRSDSAHLLLLGGVTHRHLAVSRQLCYYDNAAEVWRALRPLEEPRYQHGAALLGGFLFVVGGQGQYDTKGSTATDSAYRYDPRSDRWLQLAPLNEKRTFFHLSALGGQLYAVGGRNSSSELGSVERYDFSKNEWTFVSPMAEPRYGHAGTVHERLMYISGGVTRDTFRKDLCCYDPARDAWRRCSDMGSPRGLHCMSALGGRLYVMGGNYPVEEGDYADVLSVEVYCPAADQWTTAAPMPLGQSDAGVAVFQGRVFVLGGYQWSRRCMVDLVQCYDPERDIWEDAFGVPEPMGGVRACAMTLPLANSPLQSHAHEYPLDMHTS